MDAYNSAGRRRLGACHSIFEKRYRSRGHLFCSFSYDFLALVLCIILFSNTNTNADPRHKTTLSLLTLDFVQRALGNATTLPPPAPNAETNECSYQGRGTYRCISIKSKHADTCDQRVFSAPYPIQNGYSSDCDGYTPAITWGPSIRGRNGEQFVTTLQNGLRQPTHSCKETFCDDVFQTEAIELQGKPAIGLVKCQTAKIGTTIGPPTGCFISAIEWNKQIYLPLVTHFDTAPQWMGAPDFSFELFSDTQVDSEKTMKAIRGKLHSQFFLSVDPQASIIPTVPGSDFVVGVSEPIWSESNSIYEWPTVRVDRYPPPQARISEKHPGFTLRSSFLVTLTLLLNKRNNDEEWHPSDLTTFKEYLSDVKSSLGLALTDLCAKSWWDNPQQMFCSSQH